MDYRFSNWCGWGDLNPHEHSSPPPQGGASTNSATSAYIFINNIYEGNVINFIIKPKLNNFYSGTEPSLDTGATTSGTLAPSTCSVAKFSNSSVLLERSAVIPPRIKLITKNTAGKNTSATS